MPVPLTPEQLAGLRKVKGHGAATDKQLQGLADQWRNLDPDHQTYWGNLPADDMRMYSTMGYDEEGYDDKSSYFAEKLRRDQYASTRPNSPTMMSLTNKDRQFKALPKQFGAVNKNPTAERFFGNMGAYMRTPETGDTRTRFGGWNAHPLDVEYKAPARRPPSNLAAPSPSPSPSPAPMASSPAPMQTQPPMQAPSPTPPPMQPSAPTMGKQGGLTDKQMFKVAFLAKCVEDGLTLDQIHVRVKQALVLAEKKANKDGNSFWDAWNPLAIAKDMSWAGLAGAGVVGAGGYYMGNKVLGPGAYHLTKAPIPSKEDLLQEELVNEYDRQTDIIKRQTEMTKRKRERDRGISGVTRY